MIKKSVDIEKIRNNIQKLKSIAQNKFCAVVKANAYGHGIEICKNIADLVDYFAVANKNEALQLNDFKLEKPILILGKVDYDDFATLIENDISLTIDNEEDLYHLECIATSLNKQALVHLKYNTGMNRLGFKTKEDFLKSYNLVKQCKFVKLQGIYTHFLSQEENILQNQNALFKDLLSNIPKEEKEKLIIHASNSSAFLLSKDYAYDMVRVGLAMYGYEQTNTLKLEPALQIESQIVKTFEVKKGETIGYNASYVAKQNMTIAVISMGYADGYCRSYEKGYVLINGEKAKIVGHICMDMFMCDITHILTAKTKKNMNNGEAQCEENKVFNILKINSDNNFANFDIVNKMKNETPHIETEIISSIVTNFDAEEQNQTTYLKNNTIYKLYNNAKESDINPLDLIPMEEFLSQLTALVKENVEKIVKAESKQGKQNKMENDFSNEYATILGENGNETITAKDLAKLSNTIEYEVLTNFNQCRT